jgi:uncharacterized membrane protein YphA (DoxX/SURF4 family)
VPVGEVPNLASPIGEVQIHLDNWIVRNQDPIRSTLRVLFGLFWLIDGAFKFQPGFVGNFSVPTTTSPSWLDPWFSFWSAQVGAHTALWVYLTGTFEISLGLALVFGFLRKIAYTMGIALSLLIWAVPEGFGTPYGPSSTDIGTGIVYAMALLFLLIFDATFGPGRYSLDGRIIRVFPRWARLSEVQSSPSPAR